MPQYVNLKVCESEAEQKYEKALIWKLWSATWKRKCRTKRSVQYVVLWAMVNPGSWQKLLSSFLFLKHIKCQAKLGLVNLPPLELDLIKELLKGRVVPAPGHLGLPQLQLQHHVLEDLKRQQLDVPCQALRTTWWRVQVVDLTLLRSYFRLRDWTSRLNVFCASWVLVGLVGASRLVAASSSWGRCVQSILRTTFSSHVSKSLFQTQIADYFSYFYCNQYKILTKSLVKIYFLQ